MDWDLNFDHCYYCGDRATGIDHVPPLATRASLLNSGISLDQYIIKDVPACKECNCSIGAQAPFSLVDRKVIAKKHLRRKYRKVLEIPPWTKEEIGQLGYNLQRKIQGSLLLQEQIRYRLTW